MWMEHLPLYSKVELLFDYPAEGAHRGDQGFIVHICENPSLAYIVDIPSQDGTSKAIPTVAAEHVRPAPEPLGERFACPCCGCLTRSEADPGTYDICPVCFWEDDPVQAEDPQYGGGANVVSLNEARANYGSIGASDPAFLDSVRPPRPEEIPPSDAS